MIGKFLAISMVVIGLGLSGCDPADIPPASIPQVCMALGGGPIKYNSSDPTSQRYAAYLLALDLHQRNEIGRRLHCPKFE
jgi:hypothetical protein